MRVIVLLYTVLVLISCKKEPAQTAAVILPEKVLMNVAYGTDAAQTMDVYLPEGRSADTTRLLVLIHGGSWFMGDKSEYTDKIPLLRQKIKNYAIANINYRLATPVANLFPTQENDIQAAVKFLLQNRSSYNISSTIVLLGTSAGAHLAKLQAYKNTSPKISAVVDFAGPSDMAALYNKTTDPDSRYGLQLLLGGTPDASPEAFRLSSPIHFVSPQSPPTITIHGATDQIVPVTQSIDLKSRMETTGVPHELHIYQNTGHDFNAMTLVLDAYTKVEAFLLKHVP